MQKITEEIRSRLFELRDEKYQVFHSRLIPSVPAETVIGVRTPAQRKLAKELAKREDIGEFLQDLPHRYYEENNLHGFIIESVRDYEMAMQKLEAFLPYIDNWATCDLVSPKVFGKHLPELLDKIKEWICSEHVYTIRYGIEMLMRYYLEESFDPVYLEMVAGVAHEDYYVKMMKAWYFATALAKQYEAAVVFLEEQRMDQWTHNKTIQKAVESYRISDEQKAYLRTLRRK